MSFAYPWFFLFLSVIPIVVIMYMLKEKLKEKQVSSTFLWENALKDVEVNKPWQKLKNNFLLIIQLFIITLLVLAAANPIVKLKGKAFQNSIIIVDNSGSMNALYKEKTRLEQGKEEAIKLIKKMPSNAKITVISSAKYAKVQVSSGSKSEAIDKIKNIPATDSYGNMDDAIAMTKSMGKALKNYIAYFYTDNQVELKDINGQSISLNSQVDNVSLDYIWQKSQGNYLKVLIRINNRTDSKLSREVSIYSGEKIQGVKTVQLEPKEIKTIYFENVNKLSDYIYAEISEKDGLDRDNVIYDVVKEEKKRKVLLFSKGDLFIEKALSTVKGIQVYKTSDLNALDENYDAYIFAGETPKRLPKKGNIIFINPTNNEFFSVGKEIKGGEVKVQKSPLTNYMENSSFVISKIKDINVPSWGENIFKIGDKIAAFYGEVKGRKLLVLGFAMENSDFPLNVEFPIFINNLMKYLFKGDINLKNGYICGDDIEITPLPNSREMCIKTPEGTKENISVSYPLRPYSNSVKRGIYRITEKGGNGEKREKTIAVNFPVNNESQINKNVKNTSNSLFNRERTTVIKNSGLSFQWLLVSLVILLLIFEWIYYKKNK
ncbi:BatA and WFA domain-containing protein [Clostridium sp. KNHs214]|uniref:vWA domain-containing protein n=1 Tax=Clostridium sp. KNHs214 TaxID=1540257 RepID=UPI00054FAAE8|nr:BatA and WFA domain-containing protein [Clostridium sp. KNHs214]